jgi:hypothetical protein
VTGISWSRPDSGVRKDIIGVREFPDGRTEYLMHNEALGNPYYTAIGVSNNARSDSLRRVRPASTNPLT